MKHLLSLILFLTLPACMKIKDKNEGEDRVPQVRILQVRNITIDEPYYLVNGELVRAKDFKQDDEQNLKAHLGDITEYVLNYDHLTLQEGGIIYTMGQIVRIVAKDLESRGGLITTFPDSIPAASNLEGASGGQLMVDIQHARGDLKILMSGQKGGQGLKGDLGTPGKVAIGGGIGDLGPGFGGGGGGGSLATLCRKGQVGGVGKEGARGGPSGVAEILIRDDADFNLEVLRRGGLGGDSGEGGDGGEGSGVCKKNPSFRGPKGPLGERGPEGQLETVCVKKGEKPRQCL
ncbi:MAG: hypothetical protein J7501_15325 [Bdellovibrio sp.]|nr:hypothetical protein [Bdellovibrio sp.]